MYIYVCTEIEGKRVKRKRKRESHTHLLSRARCLSLTRTCTHAHTDSESVGGRQLHLNSTRGIQALASPPCTTFSTTSMNVRGSISSISCITCI